MQSHHEEPAKKDAAVEREAAKEAGTAQAKTKASPQGAGAAIQQPSVGRIVHFFDKRRWKDTPVAALITQVHTDKTVDLFIWRPDATTEVKQGVSRQAAKDPSFENVWAFPARV